MMKKLFLSFLAIAACGAMQAAEVNQQQAMEKAKAFVLQQSGGRRAAADIQLRTAETGLRQLHAFNMEGGGYVIVSGSDRTKEVLGYAPQGTLDGDMPAAMRKLLESYAQQIAEVEQEDGDAEQEDEEQVYAVKYNIAPLIKQKWGQEPPFNNLTPMVKDGDVEKHAPTGCVATAMAMVMKYYEWPKAATPVIPATKQTAELPAVTFNWAAMTDVYNEQSSAESNNAVAQLMQYCGAACKMKYYHNVSMSNSTLMSLGLFRFFGYDCDSIEMTRRSYVTEWEWQYMIYKDLEKKRPVICGGDGHQFIIDGYKHGDYFHINWGWSGDKDGFFQLSIGAQYPKKTIPHFPYEIVTGVIPTKTPYTEINTLNTTGFMLTMDTPSQLQRTGDSDFPAVKIKMVLQNINRLSKDNTYDVGLGLYDKDKKLLKVVEVATGQLVKYEAYLEKLQGTMTFGKGLADGHYDIYPVSRLQGAEKWEQNEDVNSNFIGADISGNQLTLTSHPRELRLQVNSINYSGTLQQGGKVTAVMNITNKGVHDFDGIIALCESKDATMMNGNPLKEAPVHIPAGKTVDVIFEFVAGEAKTYQTGLLLEAFVMGDLVPLEIKPGVVPDYYDDIVLTKALTLKNTVKEEPYKGISKKYEVVGRELDMTLNLKNPHAEHNYRGKVNVIIYKEVGSGENLSYEIHAVLPEKEVTIAPGASTDVKFYFDKLEFPNKYDIWIRTTFEGDVSNDKNDIYSPVTALAGINVYRKNRAVESLVPKAEFTVPEDALAVELNSAGVKTLTPNSNPNCLYFLDATDAKPATLEGRNVVLSSNSEQTAERILLTDGYDFMTPCWFTAKKIEYKRTFTDGEYNNFTTLLLPFTAQKFEAGGEAFTLETMELCCDQAGKVYFTSIKDMPYVGTPYIVRLKADKKLTNAVVFSAQNAYVCDSVYMMTAGRYNMTGSFVKTAYTQGETYAFADGKSGSVVPKGTSCSPFRACFQTIGMPMNFETLAIDATTYGPTAIDVLRNDADDNSQPCYNLSGQRVLHPRRGLYIRGGKKFIAH